MRGAAILAVFVQHLMDRFEPFVRARIEASAPAWLAPLLLTVLHHAWWGVDLFFVVSGFSLALGYLDAATGRRAWPSVRSFLERRATRIYPAFLVALVVTLAMHRALFDAPGFGLAIAAHLAMLQGYAAPGGITFIGAAWSLTTEASFYLLLPLLAPRLFRSRRGVVFAVALILASWAAHAALHEAFLQSPLFEASQRRWLPSRLDEFVLGALAAILVRKLDAAKAARLAPLVIASSIALLVVAFRLEGALYREPFGAWPYALLALATTSLLFGAVTARGRTLKAIAPAWLCTIGVASYGVFLFHQRALDLAGMIVGPANEGFFALLATTAVGLSLSVAAGMISWRFIEKPFLKRRSTPSSDRVPNLATGASG